MIPWPRCGHIGLNGSKSVVKSHNSSMVTCQDAANSVPACPRGALHIETIKTYSCHSEFLSTDTIRAPGTHAAQVFVTCTGCTARALTAQQAHYSKHDSEAMHSVMIRERWSTWGSQAPKGKDTTSVEQPKSRVRRAHAQTHKQAHTFNPAHAAYPSPNGPG